MRIARPPAILGVCLFCLVGCNELINRAGAEYLKHNLRQVCGEDDPACIAAVDAQFDDCHEKSRGEWNAYMNASPADEDALLEAYSRKIYACIVDENGEPWFVYDPS